MAMRTTTSWGAWLLLFCASFLAGHVQADPTCYDTWGNEDSNQVPCFASGTTDTSATTWCCNKNDMCLSNGLCLSPAANNLMTQQGCTDKSWGGACKQFCPASSEPKPPNPAIPLIPCPSSLDTSTNTIKFCCGPSATTCCSNSSAWTSVPQGTLLTSTTSSTTTSDSSSDDSSSSGLPYPLKIGLGIGLGIGVPILLVLSAVAYLLAQPLHQRKRRRAARRRRAIAQGLPPPPTTVTGGGTEKTSGDSDGGGNGGGGGGGGGRRRRDSFGRVDTNVGPGSEDGFPEYLEYEFDGGMDGMVPWTPHGHGHGFEHGGVGGVGGVEGGQWRPAAGGVGVVGGTNVAAALAAWARTPGQPFPFPLPWGPFGGGGTPAPGADRPDSPKEMDGRSGSRLRGRLGGLFGGGGGGGAAELPSDGTDVIREEGARGKVRVAAEEVELPTPDTPGMREGPSSRVVGGAAAGMRGSPRGADLEAGVQPGRSGRGYRSGGSR